MHARNEQRWLVGDQLRIGFEKASLAQVIGFRSKLALSLE